MNGFKVCVNKRIWKIVKLMMPEIKKAYVLKRETIRYLSPDSEHEN